MKIATRALKLGALLLPVLLLSGCLPGVAEYTAQQPAGFLNGVVHGWFAPLSLILQIVGQPAHMYETVNTGFSYDLGFYMAVISGFGGLALSRRRRG